MLSYSALSVRLLLEVCYFMCVCVFYLLSFRDPVETVRFDGMCPWAYFTLSSRLFVSLWRDTVMELYFPAASENCELSLSDSEWTHAGHNVICVRGLHGFRM